MLEGIFVVNYFGRIYARGGACAEGICVTGTFSVFRSQLFSLTLHLLYIPQISVTQPRLDRWRALRPGAGRCGAYAPRPFNGGWTSAYGTEEDLVPSMW